MPKLFDSAKKRILAGEFPDGWMKGTLYIRITGIDKDVVLFVYGMADSVTAEPLLEDEEEQRIRVGSTVTFSDGIGSLVEFRTKIFPD